MNEVRLFIIIGFINDDILPDFFELANSFFGKYDYFTQNIKQVLHSNNPSNLNKLRIFSFKKYINPLKMRNILKKIENLSSKMVLKGHQNFYILFGYSNHEQVILYKSKYSPGFVLVDKITYAAIQLIRKQNKWIETDQIIEEFKNPDVKNFFSDLSRIYKDKFRL